jgi:hypothetical protein
MDAEEKVDKLCDLVEQTLKQNVMLAERLSSFQTGSTVVPDSTQAIETEQLSDTGLVRANVDEPLPAEKASELVVEQGPRKFVFEELLLKSRVYRNMASDGSDTFSILSSAGRTATWSMLSGLSLSQMSNIAILALPIYASDLENKERYDFEAITDEPAVPVDLYAENASKDSLSPGRRLFAKWRRKPDGVRQEDDPSPNAPGIFGVELATSIRYANVAISLQNEQGERFIYGYIPILVGKCGVFLKEKGRLLRLRSCYILILDLRDGRGEYIRHQRAPKKSASVGKDV